jgi:hypothetical protein
MQKLFMAVLPVFGFLASALAAQGPCDAGMPAPPGFDPSRPFYAFVNQDKYLTFGLPDPGLITNAQRDLAAQIQSLDHRAHEQLGPCTPEWTEVLGMLGNAANVGLVGNETGQAEKDYKMAETAFFGHIEARNRIRYLGGLMLGILACTVLAGGLYFTAKSLSQPFISPRLLPLLCLFAGMGSLASVLTRLDQINLKLETDPWLVVFSGGARPIVAILLSLVIYLILDLKLIDVRLGSPTDANRNSIYFVTSFLCGFSERFATDILTKVMPVFGAGGG